MKKAAIFIFTILLMETILIGVAGAEIPDIYLTAADYKKIDRILDKVEIKLCYSFLIEMPKFDAPGFFPEMLFFNPGRKIIVGTFSLDPEIFREYHQRGKIAEVNRVVDVFTRHIRLYVPNFDPKADVELHFKPVGGGDDVALFRNGQVTILMK